MIENISDFIISLLPDSDYFFIFYLFFIFIFSFLLIIFFSNKKKKVSRSTSLNKDSNITIKNLLDIANNDKSTTADLLTALILFKEKFKIKGDESVSFELFKKILNHKNRNKKIFDYFHNEILETNQEFKDQLDKIEREALNRD